MSTDTAMVSANCWYRRPVMPAMKATGTNTAARIRAMPMTGAVTSDMALKVASLGESPCSMWRSTASTTTMASSTTRPMASTKANSESVLIENPSSGKHGEHAHQRDRHGEERNQRRAPALQEDEHHQHHQADGLEQRDENLLDARLHGRGGIEGDFVVHAGRKTLLEILHRRAHGGGNIQRVGTGKLKGRDDTGWFSVERTGLVVIERAHLEGRHVAHAHQRSIGFSRTMTSPNSSGVTSRPWARTV